MIILVILVQPALRLTNNCTENVWLTIRNITHKHIVCKYLYIADVL